MDSAVQDLIWLAISAPPAGAAAAAAACCWALPEQLQPGGGLRPRQHTPAAESNSTVTQQRARGEQTQHPHVLYFIYTVHRSTLQYDDPDQHLALCIIMLLLVLLRLLKKENQPHHNDLQT